MKIIFDLDYTLLDTVKFKEKIADIFNQENFIDDYKKYFKNQGIIIKSCMIAKKKLESTD